MLLDIAGTFLVTDYVPIPSYATRTTGSTAVVEKSCKVSLRVSAVNIEGVQAVACMCLGLQKCPQVAAASGSTEACYRSTISCTCGYEGGE